MQILAKMDRFGQVPRLNFKGYPKASTFVGAMLTICIIVVLLALFSVLMSSAVDTPTTTSIISPMSFTEELDLIPGDFKFCATLSSVDYDAGGNPISDAAINLPKILEQEIGSRVQAYTLSVDNHKVDRSFEYCPDISASPVAHCICLKEESLKIRTSDTLYVKLRTPDPYLAPDNSWMNLKFSLKTTITSIIPNRLSDALVKTPRTVNKPFATSSSNNIFQITLDRLIYKIDNNYLVASPKTYYSVIPMSTSTDANPDDVNLGINSWTLNFSGQTITTETTAIKILSVLAQVGALNGVFVIVFSILLLPFFKLKYAENVLNNVNKQPTSTKNESEEDKLSAKTPNQSPEDQESEAISLKKRIEDLVRRNYTSKQPLHIGFWEWLCPGSKRASKVKTVQENELAMKEYFNIASVIRTNMEAELLKKIVFSQDQLYMIDNIPFDSYVQAENEKKVQDTEERELLESIEFLKGQVSKEDMQSRFIELMKKYYD